MAVIAVFSSKGGVGKSTLAASLAWASAVLSRRETLLWDLDPQGAGAFLLGVDPPASARASRLFTKESDAGEAILPTPFDKLSLLPADDTLRDLGGLLAGIGKKRRLARLAETLTGRFERIVLDCPPGMNELSSQVLRAADVVIMPLPPAPLAGRALETLRIELARNHSKHPPILPVMTMVDRRRALHREALAEHPDWPVIPMAAGIEAMAARRQPIGAFAPSSAAAQAVVRLWAGIERKVQSLG